MSSAAGSLASLEISANDGTSVRWKWMETFISAFLLLYFREARGGKKGSNVALFL